MPAKLVLISTLLFCFLLSTNNLVAQAPPAQVSAETLSQWMTDLSNWGRWGDDDQLGTLNLITPEKRRSAAGLVEAGISVSLARDLDKEASVYNTDPFVHQFGKFGQWAGDTYTITYHGYAHSHIDAQSHMSHNGQLYNGFSTDYLTETGTERLGIQNLKNGIFTRGVLVDIPRLKGVPYLEPGDVITIEDLQAWEELAGLKVEAGDVLLIHTGRWIREEAVGPWNATVHAAGLHASTAQWLKARDVAVLGSDGASDVLPSGVEGQTHPVHQLVIIALGMPILDDLDLTALAEEAARQNRWTFLFTAAPLRVVGGTGSPLNPIATF